MIRLLFTSCILLSFPACSCFIPHPLVKFASRTATAITHSRISKKGFIRSLSSFFRDHDGKRPLAKSSGGRALPQKVSNTQSSFERLFGRYMDSEFGGSDGSTDHKSELCAMLTVLDTLVRYNALQDIAHSHRHDNVVHVDAECIQESNSRIIEGRKQVIKHVRSGKLHSARALLGALLHTLQDFYSHTNWIEMGYREPNYEFGISQNIGRIADKDQPTCISSKCKRMVKKCDLWQKVIMPRCPMVFYDCEENIEEDLLRSQILTSGYVTIPADRRHRWRKPDMKKKGWIRREKPIGINKCSHGGVMDETSHSDALGGINKDTMEVIYSPHHYLHLAAARAAVLATEYFLNHLRRELGDRDFARLMLIPIRQDEDDQDSADGRRRMRFDSAGNREYICGQCSGQTSPAADKYRCAKLIEDYRHEDASLSTLIPDSQHLDNDRLEEGTHWSTVRHLTRATRDIFTAVSRMIYSDPRYLTATDLTEPDRPSDTWLDTTAGNARDVACNTVECWLEEWLLAEQQQDEDEDDEGISVHGGTAVAENRYRRRSRKVRSRKWDGTPRHTFEL